MRSIVTQIHAAGAELIVVGNGTQEQAQWFREATGLSTPLYTDPDLNIYRMIEARRGWSSIVHPMVVVRAVQALMSGYRQAGVMGDAMQVGGVLIVQRDGSIPFVHRSRYAGDAPKPARILNALRKVKLSE